MKRSISFLRKLNSRLNNSIHEELDTIIDIAGSLNSFKSPQEFKSGFAEGSVLNVTKIAANALAIPSGNYMVWATNRSTTTLIPTDGFGRSMTEGYSVRTPKILENWAVIQKPLMERASSKKKKRKKKQEDGVSAEIDMSTVDRSEIALALEKQGFTVTDLADACGVDPSTISRIMREPKTGGKDPGGRDPSVGLAAKIATFLRIDVESLFPDLFDVKRSGLEQKRVKANKGSGRKSAAAGSRRRNRKRN
jgi:transcriptional regulator with XRE-family HTH domain